MSGRSARMRSTFGVFVPPRRGRVRPAGKMQKSVMPTTDSPAPMAKRVSVNDGTRDTTRIWGQSCDSRYFLLPVGITANRSFDPIVVWAIIAAIAIGARLGGYPLLDADEG